MNALAKTEANVDLSRYSGAEKAAIVLMSLGEEAKKLWETLEEEEIKEDGERPRSGPRRSEGRRLDGADR